MAGADVRLDREGVAELLKSPDIRRELERRARLVAAKARASAPRVTGRYADSIEVRTTVTDRARVSVVSTVHYGLQVEARHGTLARALDAAAGD